MSSNDLDLEHFKMVVEHYKQDIREYWTKANFFFLANTGLLSGYIIYLNQTNNFPLFKVALPITGIVVAGFFYLILDNSHFWTKVWRCEVLKLCRECNKFHCYVEVEEMAQEKPHKHPEFWTQLLDLAFIFVWAWFLVINIDLVLTNMFVLGIVAVNLSWPLILAAYVFYEKEKKPIKELCNPALQEGIGKKVPYDEVV